MQHITYWKIIKVLRYTVSNLFAQLQLVSLIEVALEFIIIGQSVSREVRNIMSSPLPNVSYDTKSRSFLSSQSFMNPIPRKPKRKTKSSLAFAKYGEGSTKKAKGHVATFQKKLVVFGYMGRNPPAQFTRKDKHIVMRGLLPDISVQASEEQVRKQIRDVIKSSSEHHASLCTEDDFEFIDMNGKNGSVPNVKSGHTFTGKAIKNLAGTGCVYVRMTTELFTTFVSSDSGGELPT